MILPETLQRLVPPGPVPEVTVLPFPRETPEPVRRLAAWTEAIRRTLVDRPEGIGPVLAEVMRSPAVPIGLGIVAVEAGVGSNPAPVVAGLSLGVAVHLAPTAWMVEAGPSRLRVQGIDFPVVPYRSTFRPQGHPAGGRGAAIVERKGKPHVLTAAHVLGNQALGAQVQIACDRCGTQQAGRAAALGHLYLDVAVVEISCCCGANQVTGSAGPAVRGGHGGRVCGASTGLGVVHCFASAHGASLRQAATVMQGIAPLGIYLNGAAPLTFLTDAAGQPGDSGSAVVDPAMVALVGVYCGTVDVVPAGKWAPQQRLGYAQDADEALFLFQAQIERVIT